MMDFHGKRMLVTGATGAVGTCMSESLLACGAEVIAVSRHRTKLDSLRADLRDHERLHVAECDVRDAIGVERLFAAVTQRGPLDGVVHTVGAFETGELETMSDEQVREVIDSNLLTAAYVIRSSLRVMSTVGAGSVVVVASDLVVSPVRHMAMYGAAKAGVVHLVESCGRREDGVRINALCPGIVDTAGNRAAMPEADRREWITPQALANAAVWFLGSESRRCTGTAMRFGGRAAA